MTVTIKTKPQKPLHLSDATLEANFRKLHNDITTILADLNSLAASVGIPIPGPVGPPGQSSALLEEATEGDIGPPGPQGLTGAQGPAGAYSFPLEDVIEGDQGPVGPQGPTGAQGAAGAYSFPLEEAVDGDQGPIGLTGATGFTGPTGPAVFMIADSGEDGEPGAPGPQGPLSQTLPSPGSAGNNLTSDGSAWQTLPNNAGWIKNLSVVRATTTNAGDSVKFTSGNGTALNSTSNVAFAMLMDAANPGQWKTFTITADKTIKISGATFGLGTTNSVTAYVLRFGLCNDNATLRYCVAHLGGRTTLLTTDTSATASSVTTPEGVLSDVAVASATNSFAEVGYALADYTASTQVWAIKTGVNAVVTGQIGDGIWMTNVPVWTGWTTQPTVALSRWCQIRRNIFWELRQTATATSNATTITVTGPAKFAQTGAQTVGSAGTDSGASISSAQTAQSNAAASNVLNIFRTGDLGAWTNSGSKAAGIFNLTYEVGPVASFI